MLKNEIFFSQSADETFVLGTPFAAQIKPGAILALTGDLGCRKTLFVKGLAQGLGLDPDAVRSPTFALIQEHAKKLCHADLYRLNAAEIPAMGLQEYFDGAWIAAIEWADKAVSIFPSSAIWIRFESVSKNSRKIKFENL